MSLIQKLRKIKPLTLDLEEAVQVEEVHAPVIVGAQPIVLPSVTSGERQMWVAARSLQSVDENGQPVEGWPARIRAMMADGRIVKHAGAWYRRE